ncbi:tRNA dihydrouridine synthase [Alienimonas chondri]|uniref:tRNA-dihydrouridine synthase n=1 Tax=Alienimonas chondri TaxID=2681879 RepID=A0ABX1VHA8_9PLAN|nr:tRNA-dihydrouridine synthase family protein [Alienimonas chondri]NNJ27232.1 putative tRNA-dihydrouridine synthase [Alienimonas chondri]
MNAVVKTDRASGTLSRDAHADGFVVGGRRFDSRYVLAPLAGYTHLAFRTAVRELGGLGLATTDLVLASHLLTQTKKSRELLKTSPADRPLSVQIFGSSAAQMADAARWLEDHGREGVDLNMGCPMAKLTGSGGGARLMCDAGGAVALVKEVVDAVSIPVTVKLRLGWDRENQTAPALSRAFAEAGVAGITVHGRTRSQGFRGTVDLSGIAAVVQAVDGIVPVVGNGDVRVPADAERMRAETGCDAVAIGRGALADPWIFRRLADRAAGRSERLPTDDEKLAFLRRHFALMLEDRGEYACVLFRKFAAWYGAVLGVPEDLEDKLRRFETPEQFEAICQTLEGRIGERISDVPTAFVKVPNGPVERW